MSKLYLVNEDKPAAISMVKKLINYVPVVGGHIKCSKEEIEAYYNGEIHEIKGTTSEDVYNPRVNLIEIDPTKKYLAFCALGSITNRTLQCLGAIHNIQTVLLR